MTDNQQQKRKQKARQAQRKAQINRDKARRKLLRQREKLARRRTRNLRKSEKRNEENKEEIKNPTAHSTLPPQKSNTENATRNSHSTVPETPKYSAVPARERLYGQRLHRKMIKLRDEPSATTRVSDHEADGEEVSTDE